MQRVTVTLDDDLMRELDELIAARGYQNRSEAIRDLARSGVRQSTIDAGKAKNCVAALVYVYDHHARELGKRLTQIFHDHHDIALSTLHVHLDHESCMEVAVLRGKTASVKHLAEHVIAERQHSPRPARPGAGRARRGRARARDRRRAPARPPHDPPPLNRPAGRLKDRPKSSALPKQRACAGAAACV